MKNKLLPFALPVAGLLLPSLISGLSSPMAVAAASSEEETVPAVIVPDKTIYVDFSLNEAFTADEAEPRLIYVDGEETVIVPLVDKGSDIYSTETKIPAKILADPAYSFSFFCEGELPNAENLVTTTVPIVGGSLLSEEPYDYVAIAPMVEGEAAKIYGYGHYGKRTANPGATYLSQRVWLCNQNEFFYEEDAWGNKTVNGLGYVDANGVYTTIVMPSIRNTADGTTYYYADIPMDITSFSFLRLSNTEHHTYLFHQKADIENISYGVCYFAGTETYADFLKVTTSQALKADAGLLKTVVEAYLTYGKHDSNGSVGATVHNLFVTWFANKSATADQLKAMKLLDYTGGTNTSDGYSYEGATKTYEVSVNEKWNTLCSNAGIDPSNGSIRGAASLGFLAKLFSNQVALLAMAIGGALLVSALIFVIYRLVFKRKGN